MTAAMRLAIIGDLHDYALRIWPWELLGKPLAGQANLWLNRRKRFDRTLIAPVIDRVITQRPDMALFSGDLTTTSRPREFRSIAHRLRPLLDACPSVMVAGNHDRYTWTSARIRRFEKFFPNQAVSPLPHTRALVGGWRLMVVDSAEPRPLDSMGRIGERQLHDVRAILEAMHPDEAAIVLIHYPFGKPPQLGAMKPKHRLSDEDDWLRTLGCCRGRLVIVHGHVHCPWLWKPDVPSETSSSPLRILDINAGAPTMISSDWPNGQGFWMLHIHADPAQPITLEHHAKSNSAAPVGMNAALTAERASSGDWQTRIITMSI